LTNLAGRLAAQNRHARSRAIDIVGALHPGVPRLRATRLPQARSRASNADELQHRSLCQPWISAIGGTGSPRADEDGERDSLSRPKPIRSFQIKAGEVNAVGKVLEAPEASIPAVNVEDRRLAGFTDEEIHEILRQAGCPLARSCAKRPHDADPALFGQNPERDPRFEVRELWAQHGQPSSRTIRKTPGSSCSRQLNEELNSLEIAARNLVDFPGEDWELGWRSPGSARMKQGTRSLSAGCWKARGRSHRPISGIELPIPHHDRDTVPDWAACGRQPQLRSFRYRCHPGRHRVVPAQG
jgi:hypothetical protein